MGIKRILFSLFLTTIFFSLQTYAQSVLYGNVVGEDHNPIENVNVYHKRKDKILATTSTTKDGKFELHNVQEEDIIQFSRLDYKSKTITIHQLDEIEVILETFDFDDEIVLEEVLLKNNVQVRKDTIVFNADFFRTGNEQNVEALLKKIPGVDVDSEGKIKVLNKLIERLMVNGGDMLRKNYKYLLEGWMRP
ncbi:carboxypeptidase-like regulatory domain-containing protein [Vaginella massiliensis]|uniref:carboxypeptidase-like regulatory domain-containing protein n=1 Tax=Vaginella massiliensis TaxID=1816680 RepID=UPI000839A545|nr:carboxypeptidase-like regulatory domain-containing protein [Vaginella massiliensis]